MSDFPQLAAPWSRVPLVHDDTDLFDAPTMTALSATMVAEILDSGAALADAGRKYRLFGGALCNPGTGWELIADANHRSTGVGAISQDSTDIIVNYTALGVDNVVAMLVGVDETLAGRFAAGASVGLTDAYIRLRQPGIVHDHISYNGSSWVSANGVFTGFAWNAGILTFNSPGYASEAFSAQVTGRDGASAAYLYQVSANGVGANQITVSVRDYAGALVTPANSNMRFLVTRGSASPVTVDPATVTTVAYPNSNLWFLGLQEVA